jgi:tRNA-(MS[2]IO[6]A)-hydroxylase (MiaE)-like
VDQDGGEALPHSTKPGPEPALVAEVLAALAYGGRRGARRAREAVDLAPDRRASTEQRHVADRERQNAELMEARLREVGDEVLTERFRPFFDAFFDHTEPADWVEAQTFHYVGDALVSDFADALAPAVDRVSAEIIRRALGDRDDEETFALDELTRAMAEDRYASERIRRYAQRVVGEAFTQTARALDVSPGLRTLLGGDQSGKLLILSLLAGHRQRLDRLGIEPIEPEET